MPFDRGLNVFGTAEYDDFANSDGQLPTRNFQTGRLDGAEAISGETMKETVLTDTEACWACSVKCKRVVKIDDPYAVDPQYGGPEFETVAALGSNCGVTDLAVARASAPVLTSAVGPGETHPGPGVAGRLHRRHGDGQTRLHGKP